MLLLVLVHAQMHEIAEGDEGSSDLGDLDELDDEEGGDEEDEEEHKVFREIEQEIFEDLNNGKKVPRSFGDKEYDAMMFELEEDSGETNGLVNCIIRFSLFVALSCTWLLSRLPLTKIYCLRSRAPYPCAYRDLASVLCWLFDFNLVRQLAHHRDWRSRWFLHDHTCSKHCSVCPHF